MGGIEGADLQRRVSVLNTQLRAMELEVGPAERHGPSKRSRGLVEQLRDLGTEAADG